MSKTFVLLFKMQVRPGAPLGESLQQFPPCSEDKVQTSEDGAGTLQLWPACSPSQSCPISLWLAELQPHGRSSSSTLYLESSFPRLEELLPLGSASFIPVFFTFVVRCHFFRTGLLGHHNLQEVPLLDFLIMPSACSCRLARVYNEWNLFLSFSSLQTSSINHDCLGHHWMFSTLCKIKCTQLLLLFRRMNACQPRHRALPTNGFNTKGLSPEASALPSPGLTLLLPRSVLCAWHRTPEPHLHPLGRQVSAWSEVLCYVEPTRT